MASLINCHKITKSFGSSPLFVDLSFGVEEQDKLGIIGPNGSGKSTLIKTLLQEEDIDSGVVSQKSGVSIHLVLQSRRYKKGLSIKDLILENIKYSQKNIDHIEDQDIEKVATKLLIDDIYQSADGLSGGWIKKIEIAAAFIANPDLVIFDEPTNHLDFKSILWLEESLQRASFSWLCISHDRFFLNKTCKRILELNPIFPDNFHENFPNLQKYSSNLHVNF